MKNNSVMQFDFSKVPQVKLPRSVFNRSHGWKTTMDADYLYPMLVDEVLPGDTFNCKSTFLVRLNSPSIKPFMDNLYFNVYYFFCANRILWDNWKKFMGEQASPGDSITYNVPYVVGPNTASGGIAIGHLFDYMGLPVGPLSGGGGSTGIQLNNLHGRMYNQVWNYWFRDQNLQNGVTVDTGDGPDTYSNYNLLKKCKKHDFFTSCLPWPIKNIPGSGANISLPLGSSATIKTAPSNLFTGSSKDGIVWLRADTGAAPAANQVGISGAIGKMSVNATSFTGPVAELYPANLYADLTNATAATIQSLRAAITLQQFMEKDARGGSRYNELILNHFGVIHPDLNWRPELLATYRERINITPVAQTTPKPASGTTTDQGNLSGFGTLAMHGPGFSKSFTEHGCIIGLIAIDSDINYEQGQEKMWSRRTRYDYYFPTFANISEMSVLNREIYANLPDGTLSNQKDGVFGYLPAWDDLRFKKSLITGNLRSYNGNSANANTLNVWHLAEAFASQPTLGATFIANNTITPLDRAIAVPAQDQFIVDAYHDYKCARVMPVFGVPGLTRL